MRVDASRIVVRPAMDRDLRSPGAIVRVLDDEPLTPQGVNEALGDGILLVVGDVLEFPWTSLTGEARDVPMALRLPGSSLGPAAWDVLVEDCWRHMTPHDIVACSPGVWRGLQAKSGWPDSVWVPMGDQPLDWLVHQGRTRLLDAGAMPDNPIKPALSTRARPPGPHRPEQRRRAVKARHRVERDAVRELLSELVETSPSTKNHRTLVVADDPTIWWDLEASGTSLSPLATTVQDGVPCLRAGLRFDHAEEKFDAVVALVEIAHESSGRLRRLAAEATRVLRPGGHFVLLSSTVRRSADDIRLRNTSAMIDVLAAGAGRRLMLHDVRSLRLPGEDRHHLALLDLLVVKPAKVW